tara:strand:+ start:1671 stop:2639 length:969 start_codon:yes stop_codon:yes gene_type:complete
MAWLLIPNNRVWEYDNAPPDPGANSPYRPLWLKQTAGIRINSDGQKVYTKVRQVGSTVDTMGEIAKTYWDVKGDDLKFQMEVLMPADTSFTIPCLEDGGVTFDAIIDWGDDTANSEITTYNDGDLMHTYAEAGTYTIKIDGTFPNISFANTGDKLLVTKVLNLGHVGWTNLSQGFLGCASLTEFSAGASDTSVVTNFKQLFQGCGALTTAEVGFDTSSAERVDAMFYTANALVNAPGIEKWDITNLTLDPVNNLNLFMLGPSIMTTTTYDALLVNWSAQAPLPAIGNAKFGSSKYTGGGEVATARQVLTDNGWVISDGGAAP